ncbi:MAG: hypothetical protein ABL904_11910, partial [Hyphomicrobiaceae bacterium]
RPPLHQSCGRVNYRSGSIALKINTLIVAVQRKQTSGTGKSKHQDGVRQTIAIPQLTDMPAGSG